jgi:hypothetical protein
MTVLVALETDTDDAATTKFSCHCTTTLVLPSPVVSHDAATTRTPARGEEEIGEEPEG